MKEKNPMKRLLVLLFWAAACGGDPTAANKTQIETVASALHAINYYSIPSSWGSVAVNMYYGRVTSHDSKHWLLMKKPKVLGGDCWWWEVGPADQVGVSIHVTLGNSNDNAMVAWDDVPRTVTCYGTSYTFTKPLLEYVEGGVVKHDKVSINAMDGNDYLACAGAGVCNGGFGNDFIDILASYAFPDHVAAFGEFGDDKIVSNGTGINGAGGALIGDEGNDCIWVESPSDTVTYQCGSGEDRSRGGLGNGCEAAATDRCLTYPW
jgi:hypothetical protein